VRAAREGDRGGAQQGGDDAVVHVEGLERRRQQRDEERSVAHQLVRPRRYPAYDAQSTEA
jgi:hypothetical protein